MQLANFVFLPTTPVSWLAATVAFALLTARGFQRLPIIGDFNPGANAIAQDTIPLLLLLCVFNAVLMWFHARPYYLRSRDSMGAALGSFLLLSVGYSVLYRLVIFGASRPMTELLVIGQLGVYLTLAASQLWSAPKPALDAIREHRNKVLELLDSCQRNGSIKPDEKRALDAAVGYLTTKAADSAPGVRLRSDSVLLDSWIQAAAAIKEKVMSLDASNLRPAHCTDLHGQRTALKSESVG